MFRSSLAVIALVCVASLADAAQAQQRPRAADGATKAGALKSDGGKPAPTTVININTASAAELQRLRGIGAKTAALIIEYRQKNGGFKKVEELMNVRGVGEKSFLRLRTQISVGPQKADPGNSQVQ